MKLSRTTLLLVSAAVVPGGLLLLVPMAYRRLRGAWSRPRSRRDIPARIAPLGDDIR